MIKLLSMGSNPVLFMNLGQFLGTLRHFEQAPEDQKFDRGASLLGPLKYFQGPVDGPNQFGFSPSVLQQMGEMTRILEDAPSGQRPTLPGQDGELMALGAGLRRELIGALPEEFCRSVADVRTLDAAAMEQLRRQATRFNQTPPRQVAALDVSTFGKDQWIDAYFSGRIEIEKVVPEEVRHEVMALSLRYDRLLGGPSALIPLEVIQTFPSIFPLPPPTVRQALLESLQGPGKPYGHVKDQNLLLNRAEHFLALLSSIDSYSSMSDVDDVINQSGVSLAARKVLFAGWTSICAIQHQDASSYATQVSAILDSDSIFGVMGFREKIVEFLMIGVRPEEEDDDDSEAIDVNAEVAAAVDTVDLRRELAAMTALVEELQGKDGSAEVQAAVSSAVATATTGLKNAQEVAALIAEATKGLKTEAEVQAAVAVVAERLAKAESDLSILVGTDEFGGLVKELQDEVAALKQERDQLLDRPTREMLLARVSEAVDEAVAAQATNLADVLKAEGVSDDGSVGGAIARVRGLLADVEELQAQVGELSKRPDEEAVQRLTDDAAERWSIKEDEIQALVSRIDELAERPSSADVDVMIATAVEAVTVELRAVRAELLLRAEITPAGYQAVLDERDELLRSRAEISREDLADLYEKSDALETTVHKLQGALKVRDDRRAEVARLREELDVAQALLAVRARFGHAFPPLEALQAEGEAQKGRGEITSDDLQELQAARAELARLNGPEGLVRQLRSALARLEQKALAAAEAEDAERAQAYSN